MKKSKFAEKMIDLVEETLIDMGASDNYIIGEADNGYKLELIHEGFPGAYDIELDYLYERKESEDCKVKDLYNTHVKANVQTFVETTRDDVRQNDYNEDYDGDYGDEEDYEDDFDNEDDFDDEEDYDDEEEEVDREEDDEDEYTLAILNQSVCEEKGYINRPIPNTDICYVVKSGNDYVKDWDKANPILSDIQYEPYLITNIEDMLPSFLRAMINIKENNPSMFVVHNEKGDNGATQITNPEVMAEIKDLVNGQDFYILPSSTAEFICVTADYKKADELAQIIKDVNADKMIFTNEIMPLSDNLYKYDFDRGHLVTVDTKDLTSDYDKE